MKFFEQFTSKQIKAQYNRNAIALREMELKAINSGKKVNGYSKEQLTSLAIQYEKKAK